MCKIPKQWDTVSVLLVRTDQHHPDHASKLCFPTTCYLPKLGQYLKIWAFRKAVTVYDNLCHLKPKPSPQFYFSPQYLITFTTQANVHAHQLYCLSPHQNILSLRARIFFFQCAHYCISITYQQCPVHGVYSTIIIKYMNTRINEFQRPCLFQNMIVSP